MSRKSKRNRQSGKATAPGKVRIEPWGTMDEATVAAAMITPLPCVLCGSAEQGQRVVFIPGSDAVNKRLGAQGNKFRIATVNVCPGCVREHGGGPELSAVLGAALEQVLDDSWRKLERSAWS